MSTFDDVQKHVQNTYPRDNIRKSTVGPNRRQLINLNLESLYDEDELDNLEDGDVTGYAFANTPANIFSVSLSLLS